MLAQIVPDGWPGLVDLGHWLRIEMATRLSTNRVRRIVYFHYLPEGLCFHWR